jgi:apolipoprotein N-acyltransferase
VPDASLFRAQPGTRPDSVPCRIAAELGSLTGWRRYGLAFLLGAVLAGALPPVDLAPLIFVAFPGLLWLDEGSRGPWASARLGYVFGLGFFVAGMYWIAAALFVDIDRFWWALPFAVLGLPAVLAFFPAAALGAAALGAGRWQLSPAARVCLFAVAWSATEWLRGHLFTGLPWNLVGYAWSGGFPGALAVLQSAAWLGIYGLSFVTVLAASLPALLGVVSLQATSQARHWGIVGVTVLLIAAPAAAGTVRLSLAPTVETGLWLRLVQPSIPQDLKWDPTAADENFRRLIQLSGAPAQHRLAAVLWPEAASPFLLERERDRRSAIAAVAPEDGYVITGALRGSPTAGPVQRVWNSIEAIDREGEIRAHYDKAHLVPFGEYMPLRNLLPFKKITQGSLNLSAGPGPATVALSSLPAFAPLVCYEAIFPAGVVDRTEPPAWLFNATNDAWYGRSSGPYQHFAIARTRAVEEGLPLVRVANNGISGVVDAAGRVLARTNLDDVTYADIALPEAGPPTLYARFGDLIFIALLVIGSLPVVLRLR